MIRRKTVEEYREEYKELANSWLANGPGTRAEFDALTRELADQRHGRDALTRELADQRHGRIETHRPVDLVAAARFISLSRSNPGYARWFTLWREIVATRTAQETP
jgi:hypothetical protein